MGTLSGPVLSDLGSGIVKIPGQLVRGDFANAGEDTLRLLMSNMPFVNMWYTRAAFDYLIGFHLREWMNPGTLRKTERKMKEDFNQTYIVPPSSVIKRGGGFK